jgi:S-sulfo-L-cysteine synthase (3-phospho-L-serine-dependent)
MEIATPIFKPSIDADQDDLARYIVFVEANTTGTGMLALHKARNLGFVPIFLTNNPHRYQGLQQARACVHTCDTNSIDEIRRMIKSKVREDRLFGITTTSEFYLETVAYLAATYGLPGNAPEAIHACRNKTETRLQLQAGGIRQPQFAIVRSIDDIDTALTSLSGPWIVKPADDTGSYAVRLCQTVEEATDHVARILEMHTNVRGQQTARTALIEEFLDAPEFSVEMFTWQGTTTCVGITEKSLIGFPYWVEHRHIFPASLELSAAKEIQHIVRQALTIVGITHGATHTEVKLTTQGCAIVEINARLAGGMIPELINQATGIDLLEQQIKVTVGESPDLDSHKTGCAGIQFLIAPTEGILTGIRGIEAARQIDGVVQLSLAERVGTYIRPPQSAYDRLGFLIVGSESYNDLVHRLHEAEAQLEVVVTSTSLR